MRTDTRDPYWFSAFPFPPNHFRVRAVHGREALSKPYVFDVTVTASTLLGDALERLSVGHRASLVMRVGHVPRVIPGIVQSVRAEGLREGGSLAQSTFRIVPMLSLLRHQRGSRIFQDASIVEVVERVLHAAGIATRWETTREQPRRPYITQYEESDLAFVERLLGEAGIYYWFDGALEAFLDEMADALSGAAMAADSAALVAAAAAGVTYPEETIVFGDDAATYPPMRMELLEAPRRVPVLSYTSRIEVSSEHHDKVTSFDTVRRVRSEVAEYLEYDPARPQSPLVSRVGESSVMPAGVAGSASMLREAVEDGPAAFGAGAVAEALAQLAARRRFETYEHDGYFLFPDVKEVEGVATRIRARKTKRRTTARGQSRCQAIAAGHVFRLEDHPLAWNNREHVVVSVEHRGEVGSGETVYENAFRSVPASVTYPPSVGRRRTVQSLVTATVVGPGGDDIHVDAAGRIKVHFHWDRRAVTGDTSCWIRTIQPWAGAGFGHQFIPRVGMEVAVAFEGGDPDKPVVVGSLYNGTHPTPFPLPAQKTQSGIRTQSTPGGGGHNELMFEDATGRERIYVRAERDLDEEVLHDHTALVKNDEKVKVRGHRSDEVEKNARYEVFGRREDVVRGDAAVHHLSSRSDVVEKALDQRVSGPRTLRLEASDTVHVVGKADHRYEEDRIDRVVGNYTIVVGKHDAPRSTTLRVEGTATISAEAGIELVSNEGIHMRCGTTSIRIGRDGIELQGGAIRLAGEKGSLEASKDGLTLGSEKGYAILSDKILVKTDGASLSMGTEVKVDGSKILLNSPDRATEKPAPDKKPPTEIVLTDAETNQPLPNQRFVIELDDGSQRTGVTDATGKATVDLAGGGKIRFPELREASRA